MRIKGPDAGFRAGSPASEYPRVQVWQDRLTPLWRRAAGGCHLNRKIDELIQQSGFMIERLDTD